MIWLLASAVACGIDNRAPEIATNAIAPFEMPGNGGASGLSSAAAGATPGSGGTGAPSTGGGGGARSGCSMSAVGCIGTGVALTPLDGWVEGETNGLGIQGSFSVGSDSGDGGTSTIAPNFTALNVCVQGTVAQIGIGLDGMPAYDGHWGAELLFNLAQLGPYLPSSPWARSTAEGFVRGFSFVLMGPTIPPGIRFAARNGATLYCGTRPAVAGVRQDWLFDGLETECWNPGTGDPLLPDAPLDDVRWQISANTGAAIPFSFCIVGLQAIID